MFVCLEMQTEDSQVWIDMDVLLSTKFGLTHIVWAISKSKPEPYPLTLPSNMYYLNTVIKAAELRTVLTPAIEGQWLGEYKMMIVENNSWAAGFERDRRVIASTPTNTEEIVSRES